MSGDASSLAGAQDHAGMMLDPYRLGTAQDLVAPYGFGDSGYAGSARVSTNQRGILLFDFASLSGPVADATLVLQVSDRSWSSIQSRMFDVHGRGGDSGFNGLDYELKPNSSAGSFAYSGGLVPIAVDITRVPEPSSLLMLITGLGALGLLGSAHRGSRSNAHRVGLMIGE